MVGTDDLPDAVALNSLLVSAARAIGPAAAGVLIVLVGVGPCFLINAGTFVAIIVALAAMNVSGLHPAPPAARAGGQLVEGFRHVRRTPGVWIPLLMMAIIGTFAYEFQVVLPLVARRTFSGNADTYGFLTSALGVGAVLGGLTIAAVRTRGLRGVVVAAALFGVALLGAAAVPFLWLELTCLVAVGAFSVAFMAGGNTTVQLAADPSMRGRVMALWTVAFLGSTPIGGPIDGYVAQHAGPSWALALGGAAALIAAAIGAVAMVHARDARTAPRVRRRSPAQHASDSVDRSGG